MTSDGLRVVIVGGGFGGLCAAIECRIRGMNPVVVEAYPTSTAYGDIIDFFPNGGRIIEKWDNGRVSRELMSMCINQGDRFEYYMADGTLVWSEPWLLRKEHFWRQYAGHRGQMHQVFVDYAKRLGVELRFGDSVAEYIDGERPGVITKKGTKYFGDVVIAADGPRSKARQQVLGLPDAKVNSGYAIYRAYYSLSEEHKRNPYLKEFCNPDRDLTMMWVAKDLHAIIYTWNKGRDLGWVLTHKDSADIGESWSFSGRIEDVLKCIDEGGFEQKLREVVLATPESRLVDYKLVWRQPLTTWLSKSSKIALIGDAAHCHLPTSAQGGSQALEDGVALAVALQRAKGDVTLGLKVFERIRFNRSHVIHMSSIQIRDGYHTLDEETIKKHPETINLPRWTWVIEHDAEANAEKHFDHLAQDVRNNRQGTIEELSVPAEGDFSIAGRVDHAIMEKSLQASL
ncbi:uncharacterized protein A1O5_04992 [Cladophialophora psammophila CBS 110553]|uniref:FAD-binding domain-containing protein n=1 Tax=Cladophialophora psammophila CBS 110553 TaxID=1182543 RepID=W9WWB0_9EURO|nr:uncharacterized protein A1O5_04992 [Cladophialophora psammophila CBS 110553]EXJ72487.1 hypothetical protein A1O5_04992 [Cladophialophora psammophila CBS 110553]